MTTRTIPKGVERISMNDDGTVDDVAISLGKGMFRLEQLSERAYWLAIYMPDGRTHRFNLYATKKGRIKAQHEEEPAT